MGIFFSDDEIRNFEQIYVIACGSASYIGVNAQYVFEDLVKEKHMTTMAIVNVVGSSIAREADKVFYTLAGPEISVATTKAYSAQLIAMYCLAVQFAKVRGKLRKTISNMLECKSRGAYLMGLTNYGNYEIEDR